VKRRKYIYHIVISIVSVITVACVQDSPVVSGTKVTSTLVSEMTPTPLHTTSTPEIVSTSPATPVSTSTLVPVDELDIVDSLILYVTVTQVADEEFWALRTWPDSAAFDHPIFKTFYGEVQGGDDGMGLSRYFFNFRPQVSPNGRYTLLPGIGGYTNPNGDLGTGLWLLDLQTGSIRQILSQAKITTWNPQSDQLTYIEDDTLYTLAVNEGAVPQPLFKHPDLNGLYARWSPDGKWIATMTYKLRESHEDGGPETVDTYWIIPIDGGPARELATGHSFAIEHVAEEMTWSPNSQFLLVRNEVFDLDGKQISPTYPGQARWLDNQQLQLLINSDDGLRLTTVEGVEIAMISNSFSNAWELSRDGRRLAYSQSINSTQTDIFIFDLISHENQFIGSVPVDHLAIIRWSGDGNHLIIGDRLDATPIWAMNAQPNSAVANILDKGILAEVVATSGQ
jgi:hypothetical protein